MKYLLFLVVLTTVYCHQPHLEPFKTIYSWKQLDYNFPNDSVRKLYIDSGAFIPQNSAPLGLNIWNDKLFLTVPRWRKGVVATLNYINITESKAINSTSPLLNPYPDWKSNDINTSDSLVHIIRPRIDVCNRLWAVDSGIEDSFGERKVIQPQRLIAIDLNTDKIILKYIFKDSDIKPDSLLADLVIDVDPDHCDNAYVYNSDNTENAIVVYSMAQNDSWRITHNYFRVDPLNSFFNASGIQFTLPDGILGLSLSEKKPNGYRELFFHSIGGIHEFSVTTRLLVNRTALADKLYYNEFQIVGSRGPNTQATSSVLDEKSNLMYMTQINQNAIACWDTHRQLNPRTFYIVAQHDEKLSYTNDIIIDPLQKNVYILSDKLPKLLFDKYNLAETNFYVHVASLENLKCACKRNYSRAHSKIRVHWMNRKGVVKSMSWPT